jgi:endonuclease IV
MHTSRQARRCRTRAQATIAGLRRAITHVGMHAHTEVCGVAVLVLACMQAVEQQLQEVDVQLEDTAGRASIIADHLTNVQQEISYAQHRVRMV